MTEERRKTSDFDAYFNTQFEAKAVYLEPGQVLADQDAGKMFVANVGSGILLTMHDRDLKFGAMAYVILPQKLLDCFPHFEEADKNLLQKTRQPLEDCIGEMKRRGAGKNRLHVRLIGGARMPDDAADSGTKSYIFAREYIIRKGIPVLNEDWGGKYVRRVHFFPATGRAVRLMLRRASDFKDIQALEQKYRK